MPPSPIKDILYRHRDGVKVGELYRYIITYTPTADATTNISDGNHSLWLKVRNLESVALRAAYLAGPYILYVDVRPEDYDQNKKAYSSADQPSYEPQLKAGQSFQAQLFMNKLGKSHTWIVEVVSQIIFSPSTKIHFELVVGRTKDSIHNVPTTFDPAGNRCFSDSLGSLEVKRLDTLDLWHSPTPAVDRPLHLVIITHGLHSNTGADMLFIKEKIDEMALKTNENVAVRGYFDNVCRTEKGIKYLGRRMGDYILKSLIPSLHYSGVTDIKISFIGHSLGGLVQTFALAHIQNTYPDFFDKVAKPEHFICLATPFLGLSNENPKYVKFVLDVGFAGKSGRDLGLTWKLNSLKKHHKPLLQILPTGPAHKALVKFKRRTIYANAVNDGIVPLRTSSILYLDWKGISKASMAQRGETISNSKLAGESFTAEVPQDPAKLNGNNSSDSNNDKGSSSKAPVQSETGANGTNNTSSPIEFFNTVSSPLLSFFSFMAPQIGSKKHGKIYKRSQTIVDSSDNDDDDDDLTFSGIPKSASAIESGISVLVPPLPPPSFINDPDTRPEAIFHDKIYREQDLPPRMFRTRSTLLGIRRNSSSSVASSIDSTSTSSGNTEQVEKSKLEERLARDWHRDLVWRKVLVRLEPDAHNNIIVRRRFANAYGWPVIDHLVENHFGSAGYTLTPSPSTSGVDLIRGEGVTLRTPFSARHSNSSQNKLSKKPDEDYFSFSRDLSSMAYDMDAVDEEEISPNLKSDGDRSPSLSEVYRKGSLDRTSSWNSDKQAWESHLKISADDSDDDGIVGLIDNIRGLGSLPSVKPEDVSPVPLGDRIDTVLMER